MSTVFITGASGYIGGSVAAALLEDGYRVRGLVRTQDKADQLAARGVEPVLGSLDDAPLLSREARAADAVINTASADHGRSIAALISALSGTSKTLLHTSGASVVGDDAKGAFRSEHVYSEHTPFDVAPLKRARRQLDLSVMAAAQSGVRAVVICPSNIYGTGKGLHTQSYQIPFLAANALEKGRVQIVGAGMNVWSNVHIEDVVKLYLLALEKAAPGAFHFVENGEASFAELGQSLALRLDLPRVECVDPIEAARMWGEPMAYFSLGSNCRVRATRAREELGWQPRHSSVTEWIMNEMPTPVAKTHSPQT